MNNSYHEPKLFAQYRTREGKVSNMTKASIWSTWRCL